jgi:hypothetical protein
MTISADALELIDILSTEGFGTLAGELLVELTNGSEEGTTVGTVDDQVATRAKTAPTSETIRLEGQQFTRAYFPRQIRESSSQTANPVREDVQLRYAVDFLKIRLLEPLLAYVEAEEIAGELSSLSGGTSLPTPDQNEELPLIKIMSQTPEPRERDGKRSRVRFEFVDPEMRRIPSDESDISSDAKQLARVLGEIGAEG